MMGCQRGQAATTTTVKADGIPMQVPTNKPTPWPSFGVRSSPASLKISL